MANAHWLARVDVTDPEAYQAYVVANAKAFATYKARFLVRAGRFVVKEGGTRTRNAVIEFDNYVTALACHESAEYGEALPLHQNTSVADAVIVEGHDGPQPG
jgi:uncharacterized protein (DUF1330 family)